MDALMYHTASVAVQFSGNKNTYHYLVRSDEWAGIGRALSEGKEVRVIVPGKVKDDRLSLSIATVTAIADTAHAEAVLPIVGWISPDAIDFAKTVVVFKEQQAAALGDAQGATA